MIPLPEPESDAALTPGFAVFLALAAGMLRFAILLMLVLAGSSGGSAPRGMATLLAFGFVFTLAVPRIPGPPAFHLGFVRPPRLAWWAALFLVASILIVSEADNVSKAFWPLPDDLPEAEPPQGWASQLSLALVLVGVLPAVQEIFFRGLLQPPMVKLWGAARGIAFVAGLNAVCFALLNPWALAPVAAASAVLGVLRYTSHSILPGLALHAAFGLTAFFAAQGAFQIPGFDDTSAAHTPLGWLAPAALLTGIGFGLCNAAAATPAPEPPPEESPDPS